MGLGTRRSKVADVIEKYDLAGMGETLEAKWTGDGGERTSLRDLADELNRAILESAIDDANGSVTSIDIAGIYHTLSETDAADASRIRQQRNLERQGVDIEDVLSDFVTHQTVHTFLTEHRNAEFDDHTEDIVEKKTQTIERLSSRASAVSESSLQTLINAGEITDREYRALVDIRIVCSECGSSYTITTLIEQGGCSCSVDEAENSREL